MLDKLQLLTIKAALENQNSATVLPCVQLELQNIVYQLGGTNTISGMSEESLALYLIVLLEMNR